MQGIETCWFDLANAIVLQAVEDYRKALKGTSYDEKPADSKIITLERFFRSTWYRTLTKVDGEYLIEQIRKEVLGEEQK